MAAFTNAAPHRRKVRIPPGPDARAAAQVLRSNGPDAPSHNNDQVIDLAQWADAARGRNTLS